MAAVGRRTSDHMGYAATVERPIMKWRFIALICIVGVLVLAGCSTRAKSVASISLDFPHGALRLLVQRDSDTRLFYGALPTSRVIPSDTFDIEELFTQLQSRLYEVVPAEERTLGQPYGMATIDFSDGSSDDYLLYDGDYAGELFKRACQHGVDEVSSSEALFERECEIILGVTP